MLVFFFQAEDGIRDLTVTGVQTCALPICEVRRVFVGGEGSARGERYTVVEKFAIQAHTLRSEERRVGKECRSGWSPDLLKKTKDQRKLPGESKIRHKAEATAEGVRAPGML